MLIKGNVMGKQRMLNVFKPLVVVTTLLVTGVYQHTTYDILKVAIKSLKIRLLPEPLV